MTLGYILVAYTAERIGKARMVVVFWLMVIPCAVGIALSQAFMWIALFFIARRFFAMTPNAAWNSFMFEWIPPKHRGKTLGLLQTGQRGARSAGTLLGGVVFGILGVSLFPLAMLAYPLAGLIPLLQAKRVKTRLRKVKGYDPTLHVMGQDVK
jgi:MFS family permease